METETKQPIEKKNILHYATEKPINFIRYEYEIGQEVILNFNACNQSCGCFWDKTKAPFLQEDVKYKIEDITYFGGGCPSIILHLEGVPETDKKLGKWWDRGVPANWFKTNKINNYV